MDLLRERLIRQSSCNNQANSAPVGSIVGNATNYVQSRLTRNFPANGKPAYFIANAALLHCPLFPGCVVTWRDSDKDLEQYTTITNYMQRWMYQEEFEFRYPEYQELHTSVTRYCDKFKQLADNLQKFDPATDEYKRCKAHALLEHKVTTGTPTYRRLQIRFYLLHRKMSLIKKLILEFDLECLLQQEREELEEEEEEEEWEEDEM